MILYFYYDGNIQFNFDRYKFFFLTLSMNHECEKSYLKQWHVKISNSRKILCTKFMTLRKLTTKTERKIKWHNNKYWNHKLKLDQHQSGTTRIRSFCPSHSQSMLENIFLTLYEISKLSISKQRETIADWGLLKNRDNKIWLG